MPGVQEMVRSLKAAGGTDERLALLKSYAAERDGRQTAASYDFERDATDLAVDVPGLIQDSVQVVRGNGGDPSFRFLCMAIAFNGLRRERHPRRAREVLDWVSAEFGEVPLFGHFRAMSLQDGTVMEMRQGLELAEKAHRRLPDNAGIDHTCAVFIADLASNEAFDDPIPELKRGVELVTRAIDSYGKRGRFFHTRARLKRLLHDYDGARVDIAQAIDLEREGEDAPERRAQYLIERSMIDADRYFTRLAGEAEAANARLTKDTARLQSSIESSQIQTIEVIGFITAILGLVLATMGEIRSQSPQDALTVIAGVAVLLFGIVLLGSWLLRRGMRR